MHAFAAIAVVLSLIASPVVAIPLPSFASAKLDIITRAAAAQAADDIALLGRMHSRDFRRIVPEIVEPRPSSISFSREDVARRNFIADEVLVTREPEPVIYLRAHPRDFRAIQEARRMEEAREVAEIARAIIEPVLYAREHTRDFRRAQEELLEKREEPVEAREVKIIKAHPRDFSVPTVTKKAVENPTLSRKYSIQHRSSEGPQCAAKRRLNMLD
ncbi:hypothetical protein QCA50_015024 [Cerrena zonata]|uniref:Uncharacterized protein n=1 Tax=Cerrena zonata TaxID=2478898 RepID=A0AAW0FZ62_9APHY